MVSEIQIEDEEVNLAELNMSKRVGSEMWNANMWEVRKQLESLLVEAEHD
jgi:hypothetical protein